jgi:uncharacterized membrane protein
MALVEKSQFGSKPAFALGVDMLSTKRFMRRLVPLISTVLVTAVLYRLFVVGHPFVAIWAATAILAWLFVRGASRAGESG